MSIRAFIPEGEEANVPVRKSAVVRSFIPDEEGAIEAAETARAEAETAHIADAFADARVEPEEHLAPSARRKKGVEGG